MPNFRILTQVVAEKSLTEKNLQTDTQTNINTEKAKTTYPYILRTGGITSFFMKELSCTMTSKVGPNYSFEPQHVVSNNVVF